VVKKLFNSFWDSKFGLTVRAPSVLLIEFTISYNYRVLCDRSVRAIGVADGDRRTVAPTFGKIFFFGQIKCKVREFC